MTHSSVPSILSLKGSLEWRTKKVGRVNAKDWKGLVVQDITLLVPVLIWYHFQALPSDTKRISHIKIKFQIWNRKESNVIAPTVAICPNKDEKMFTIRERNLELQLTLKIGLKYLRDKFLEIPAKK